MKNRKTVFYLFVVVMGLSTSACLPVWTGNRMQDELESVKAQQQSMLESSKAEREEITQMIAGARADVVELEQILAEARDLLQKNSANLGVEIHQAREELQQLRGKQEELEFRFTRLEQGLQLFKEDVDLRLAGGAGVVLPQDPAELMEMGTKAMSEKDYRSARRAFEAILSKHPKFAKADEAVFLVGESFFAEGQWVGAIFEYQKILQNYPRSSRRSAATYGIGESFAKLGKCEEAGVFFETVVNEHPGSRQVRDAREYLKKIKAGSCS